MKILKASQFYQPYSRKKLRQGDIALCEFHQLRSASGEPRGPGEADLANEVLPYLGPYRDYPLEVTHFGSEKAVRRALRVWTGYGLVVHQNCELDYADENDSRVQIAPIVTKPTWEVGPWPMIESGSLPAYFYLPGLDADEASVVGLDAAWPEGAVALASTTLVSRGIVKSNRVLGLTPEAVGKLQELLVRFSSVRGWGSHPALEQLVGYTVKAIYSTQESVAGPAPLAKVLLEKDGETEEITVAWGVRRSGATLAA